MDRETLSKKLAEKLGFAVEPMYSCNGHILSPHGDHIGQADEEHVKLWNECLSLMSEREWVECQIYDAESTLCACRFGNSRDASFCNCDIHAARKLLNAALKKSGREIGPLPQGKE